jgi:hypothetical protein
LRHATDWPNSRSAEPALATRAFALNTLAKTGGAGSRKRRLWVFYVIHDLADLLQTLFHISLAGVPGFEPGLSVLETDVLTVDTIPLQTLPIANLRLPIDRTDTQSKIGNWQSAMLLGFFVISVFAATATELAELKPIRRGFLILGRYVVATLAINTLKNNIIAWHPDISDFRLPIADWA